MYNPRPSTLHRDMVCPSWHKLPGEEGQSEYAEEGTRLHDLIAGRLQGCGIAEELSEEDREIIDLCIEFCKEKTKGTNILEAEVSSVVHYCKGLIDIPPEAEWYFSGTADVVATDGKFGERVVIDWKMGYQPLHHDRVYMQLGAYALMVLAEGVKQVNVYAYMPRIDKRYHQLFTRNELLLKVGPGIQAIRDKCNAPGMTLEIDGAGCEHCPKKAVCPLIRQETSLVAELPTTELMTTDQIKQVLKLAPLVDKIHKEVKKRCIQLDKDGALPEGIYIKEIAGDRYFPDLLSLWGYLDGLGLMNSKEFIKLCKLSYGNLEKALKVKVKDAFNLKTGHIKKMEELISPFVDRGDGKKQVRLEE